MKPEPSVAVTASMTVLQLMPYLAQIVERAAREANTLSMSQAAMLSMVSDTPLRGSEIAKRLGVSRAAVTEAAQRLETGRLIKRRRDPGDQRSWFFRTTPAGRRALEAFGKVVTTALAEHVHKLPSQRQQALLKSNSSLLELFSERSSWWNA